MEAFMMLWLPSLEMNMATYVQICDETVYILHCANSLVKGMNPIILLSAMGK